MERTLAILKPDCVEAKLVGKVIDRILDTEFKIIAMKMVKLNKRTAGAFYAVHVGKPFFDDLVTFMSSNTCIPMVLEKYNAVDDFRKLIGATDPTEAVEGTIRKEFATSKQKNIVHASDSAENAAIEIAFFFSDQELVENYDKQ